jgi:hypothetical protein
MEPAYLFSLPTEITKIENDLITVRLEKNPTTKEESKLPSQLAQGIRDSSYFLEQKGTILTKTA